MIFRFVLFLCLVLQMISCDFIEKSAGLRFASHTLDTIVNFNKVDEFPVFPDCNNLIDTATKNRCFINNIYNHLSKDLLEETFGVPDCIDEKVIVKIKITSSGVAILESIESSDLIKSSIPKLEAILTKSVHSLPKLFPALKRGIPVTTVFNLPVVVKLNN